DYRRQRAAGIADPVFTRNTIPELARVLPADVWGEHGPLPQRPASAQTARTPRAAVSES
ncbi:sodium:alanine symporter family protein, partial [Ralstonia pickettii]|nr:sodium:alanine symporter family protein [Ralstonia pickettii]